MRTPTEFEIQELMHRAPYDPVKAHEYYMRTRKLKGRRKANPALAARRKAAARKKFLESLPLAQEGMPLDKVNAFVKSLEGKSDEQVKAEIAKFKAADAKSANPSPKGGLEAMTAQAVLNRRTAARTAAPRAAGVAPQTGRAASPFGGQTLASRTRAEIAKGAKARQRKELKEQIDKMENRLKKLEKKIAEKIREEKAEDRKGKAKKERAAKEAAKPKTAAEKAEAAREAEKYRDKNQQKLKNDANKSSSSSGGSSKTGTSKSGGGERTSAELKTLATKVKGQIQVAKQKLAAL